MRLILSLILGLLLFNLLDGKRSARDADFDDNEFAEFEDFEDEEGSFVKIHMCFNSSFFVPQFVTCSPYL